MLPVFKTDKRYTVCYGGRGSSKSWTIADMLLVSGMETKLRILCCREIQKSIKDSIHRLLSDKIVSNGFDGFYKVTNESIEGLNGTNFLFKGLYQNIDNIKSTEGVDICHVEESQSISRRSIDVLIPTIRKDKSRIIFTMNPTTKDDVVYTDYILPDRDDTLKIQMNYYDNPFFPDVLRQEMMWCRKTDVDRYNHVWLGEPIQHSEAQIYYGKWIIDDFEAPEKTHFYFGADWGFSQDPNALVRCHIIEQTLYIDYECGGVGIDIDKIPDMFKLIPESDKHMIIADSARPETISYMRKNGFNVQGTRKGKGSIEDGIQKLRSFEKIIIHPRCKNLIDEFRLYSYKIDKLTGRPTSIPEDKNNHYLDSLRYALENVGRTANIVRW